MNAAEHQVFETALKHAKMTSNAFPSQLCDNIDTASMRDYDHETKDRIREIMVAAHETDQYLFDLQELSTPKRSVAKELLLAGEVAAVDGTDAMQRITFMSTSAYACAVGYVTSQRRSDPHITITSTNTTYMTHQSGKAFSTELGRLCDELDSARVDQSWTTTFREYHERETALICGTKFVLLDGPVWTQNLVSQPSGRTLYTQMDQSKSSFIGVIKDISGSWTLSKWCGYSLEPGEGFVVGKVKTQFASRFKQHVDVKYWVDNMSDDYVRVVFRPNQKAFAMECRLSDLPIAMAIILEDASRTINHEIPLLLETIDAQIRAGFHGSMAADLVIARLQHEDYRMGVDVTNEREYR
jgi:hypothetical protein